MKNDRQILQGYWLGIWSTNQEDQIWLPAAGDPSQDPSRLVFGLAGDGIPIQCQPLQISRGSCTLHILPLGQEVLVQQQALDVRHPAVSLCPSEKKRFHQVTQCWTLWKLGQNELQIVTAIYPTCPQRFGEPNTWLISETTPDLCHSSSSGKAARPENRLRGNWSEETLFQESSGIQWNPYRGLVPPNDSFEWDFPL